MNRNLKLVINNPYKQIEEKQFFEASKKSETFTPNPTGNDKSFFDRVKEMFG